MDDWGFHGKINGWLRLAFATLPINIEIKNRLGLAIER